MAKKKDAETSTEAPAEKMTQREAVEKAIEAGKDLPAEGVPYVLKEFGITLSNSAFSTVKSKLVTANKAAKKTNKTAANAVVARKPINGKVGNPAELALAVKELVAQHGADVVKSMVDVFKK